jgi:hypothetical protein
MTSGLAERSEYADSHESEIYQNHPQKLHGLG